MKKLLIVLLILPFSLLANPRSDTLDVLHYHIQLNITDFANQRVIGSCELTTLIKQNNVARFTLDLMQMQVDSIKQNQQQLSFQQLGELIHITLSNAAQTGDTVKIEIFYSGTPAKDPSGWGGFYFSTADGGYAFNLGVGFTVDPPGFGRAWFPCNDDFNDKATYSFQVTTPSNKKAFCNGLLNAVDTNPDLSITWHYHLNQPISTYLASVAVANYQTISFHHIGQKDTIPIVYGVHANDSTRMKASFQHIHHGIDAFETCFGPHAFDKIGFVIVPFSGGAMEHATNIAYPKFAIDGTLSYETLWAHELSHHWWGNLVTCRTPADMWINEGFASYSEKLFLESVYGRQAYIDEVRSNHKYVLHFAHLIDNGWHPISPIPFEYTYGTHVYRKGADAAHTLRSYLGDSLFFFGIQSLLRDFAYQNINSVEMRDYLSQVTGVDLMHFFNNWIFSPGNPHFSIDSVEVISTSPARVRVHVQQKLRHAPSLFTAVPLTIRFYNQNRQFVERKIELNGRTEAFDIDLPFVPALTLLDPDGLIADARTTEYVTLGSTGSLQFQDALFSVNITQITDSLLLAVEHNWVAADGFKTPTKIRVSPDRYWKVSTLTNGIFTATANIVYDGRTPVNPTAGGYLDHNLITGTEDSIVLLYRAHPGHDWQVFPDYNKFMGSVTDRRGFIQITNLLPGEYALGYIDFTAGENKTKRPKQGIQVYPNPSNGNFTVTHPNLNGKGKLVLFSLEGKKAFDVELELSGEKTVVEDLKLLPGTYILHLQSGNRNFSTKVEIN